MNHLRRVGPVQQERSKRSELVQPFSVDEDANATTSCGLAELAFSSGAVAAVCKSGRPATAYKVSFVTQVNPDGAGNLGEVLS